MSQLPARVVLCLGVLLLLMQIVADGAENSPRVGLKTSEQWANERLKMEFLWCSPGSFMMGSPQDEPERVDDEAQVPVTLTKGFWLGKYEVTQDQWKTVMQTEPWVGKIRVRIAPDSPACWLNWDQAHLYCQELTRQERASGSLPSDWEYVLPTEAQWEYACRAGTTTKYSFGDDDARLIEYAWYGEQERQPQQMHARAVGLKKPNPWGFYDMHGNVVEWCRDWYRPVYPGGTDPYVGTEYNNRVTLRGGEWRIERKWSRAACRQNLLPSGIAATIGFRVSLQQGDEARTASGPTIKLAVVSFENRGKVLAYERIGPALSGLVAGRLSQSAALDILERQSAQDLTSEATLAQTGVAEGNSADQPKEFADYVLSGVCEVVGKQVKVAAKLTKPGIPQPLAEWKHQQPIDQLFELENELSRDILAALKVGDEVRLTPKALPGDSPIVAILPFVNHSPSARLDDMQLGFAELLQSGLGEIPGIRLVERGQINKILTEQKLSISGMIDPKTAVQVGKLAGAHRLLTGSFLELGGQISLQARMINTRTGAVVASSKVSGARGKFGELTDDLIRRITGQLEIAVPEEEADAGASTRIGRSLESALHAASADRFEREGNLPKAMDALRQVLLLEPHSTMAHINLIRVLSAAREYEEIVKVGEHGLLYPREYARCMQKYNLLLPLAHAYSQTQRYDALERLYEKYVDDCGLHRIYFAETIANVRIRQKRFPEATRLMEEIAEKDAADRGVLRSEALRSLFRFHVYHSTSVVGIPIKDHQDAARKAIAVYERVLEAAKDGDPADLAAWAQVLIPAAINLQTISDDNKRVAVLTPDQIAAYQRREYEVFSQVPGMGAEHLYKMAISLESSGAWADAVSAYQRFLEETPDVSTDYIQPFFGNNGWMLFDWIDKRIEAQYRVASIQAKRLREEDKARESFRTLVNDFGVAHFAGPDTFVEMHELNLAPEIPARSALVWGGSTSNLVGWRKILAAESLRMHAVRKDRLTLTDIAPYDVVVINLSGNFPFTPSEVLALRNYVAYGGSVLIVVSPAWQAAAPILHNSLLTLFDMQADEESIPIAKSTEIRPHPITKGISAFTAYRSVGLQVPDKASLIKSGDKTILAAADYRQGRIVVAAVGGWYTPEILLVPEIMQSVRKPVPQRPIPEDVVQYRGNEP